MQERGFYSKGFNAGVYEVSPQERLWFPYADLVRVDALRPADAIDNKSRFAKLFYRHKIAQILFPDNFINVVAVRVEVGKDFHQKDIVLRIETPKGYELLKSRKGMLYSQKADIPAEHSIFSAHMNSRLKKGGYRYEKASTCSCKDCMSHRAFHSSNALADKARKAAIPMRRIGISPDYSADPSDYCLTGRGNIVFFEMRAFDGTALAKHLSSLRNPSSKEQETLILIKRYNKLPQKVSKRI